MDLAMAEKHNLIDWVAELIITGIINADDRDKICRICVFACKREWKGRRSTVAEGKVEKKDDVSGI